MFQTLNPGTESEGPAPSAISSATDTSYPHLFRIDSAREAVLLIVASLVFALVVIYPMFCDVVYIGPGLGGWLGTGPHLSHFKQLPLNGDTDMFDQLRWVPYYTVTQFHQWPFWNPYKCGGMTMLGNPESGIVTLFFVLFLALGLVPALILELSVISMNNAFSFATES